MKELARIASAYRVISIVGNAKNAGKTTVLNHLIEEFRHRRIAITSIGLDGEAIDQITFLPKPRIQVHSGMLVLTASDALKNTDCGYRILERIPIETPLGKLVLLEVLNEGKVLLAGPSSMNEMEEAIRLLDSRHPIHILIDGAFSRASSATLADGVLYCVGGAYSTDPEKVISNAVHTVQLFSIPEAGSSKLFLNETDRIVLFKKDGSHTETTHSSVFSCENLIETLTDDVEEIYLPRAATDSFIRKWLGTSSVKLILKNPTSIVVNDSTLKRLVKNLDRVSVLHGFKTIAVCVNPTSPYHQPFDSDSMIKELEDRIDCPVVDVLREGGKDD